MKAETGNQKQQQDTESGSWVVIDQAAFERHRQELRANQNMSLAILGGVGGAILGAAAWAIVTALTGYQTGIMALAVGFLVGSAVRLFGKGIDTSFRIVGGVLSLLGCLAGNLLTVCIVVCRQEGIRLFDVLSSLNAAIAVELMKATFNPIDLLFYGIAIYEGYRFALRRITEEELAP